MKMPLNQRTYVGVPQVVKEAGKKLLVRQRSDGFCILICVDTVPDPDALERALDSYLSDHCCCDSSAPVHVCPVHKELQRVH